MDFPVQYSLFNLSEDHFRRVGFIVRDYTLLCETDLRRKLISIFRHEVSENHFKAMYYHLGLVHATREMYGDLNNALLWLKEN